jgi:hypothetical protein
VDSVRAESIAGVKERVTRSFWTAFALSLLARGERVRIPAIVITRIGSS